MFIDRLIAIIFFLPVLFSIMHYGMNAILTTIVIAGTYGLLEWRAMLQFSYIPFTIYWLLFIFIAELFFFQWPSAAWVFYLHNAILLYLFIYCILLFFYPGIRSFIVGCPTIHRHYVVFASIGLLTSTYIAGHYLSDHWLILGIGLIFAADTSAYLVGIIIGGRKAVPHISPNKTISGTIGAFILPLLLMRWGASKMSISSSNSMYYELQILAIIITIFSIAGDLIISMFKRACNIKDSSNTILGHGGLLDRLDSIFVGLPLFVMISYCWIPSYIIDRFNFTI